MYAIVNTLKLSIPLDAGAENVRPYLGGPVDRKVGEVILDTSY